MSTDRIDELIELDYALCEHERQILKQRDELADKLEKLEEYNDFIKSGKQFSHLLFIQITPDPITLSNSVPGIMEDNIQIELFHHIHNEEWILDLNGTDVNVKWIGLMTTLASSKFDINYYCDVKGMWLDPAVKRHTEIMLKQIQNNINEKYPNTRLSFHILKPMTRQVTLPFIRSY
jgi:hypothetical protein